MDSYTIYCTEAQTKKAFELGAPIIKVDTKDKRLKYYDNLFYPIIANYPFAIPTTEQMINWLEDQEIILHIFPIYRGQDFCVGYKFSCEEIERNMYSDIYDSRNEATLAAIDVALDYLNKNKKNG